MWRLNRELSRALSLRKPHQSRTENFGSSLGNGSALIERKSPNTRQPARTQESCLSALIALQQRPLNEDQTRAISTIARLLRSKRPLSPNAATDAESMLLSRSGVGNAHEAHSTYTATSNTMLSCSSVSRTKEWQQVKCRAADTREEEID